MVNKKFKPDEEVVDTQVLEQLEDETETSVAVRQEMSLGQMDGDVSISDLKFPRLQVAYGVGGLAENFSPGDLVLDKEHLLAKKGVGLRVVIVNTLTYWKEYTVYGTGNMPRTFNTEQEAIEAGLTTKWTNGEGPQVRKAMDLRLLIEKPEGLTCGLFGIEADGKEYAPATWSVDKTAYDRVNSKITPVASFALRKLGLLYGAWEIYTGTEKTRTGNVIVVPNIKYVGLNSDQLVTDIKMVFGQA